MASVLRPARESTGQRTAGVGAGVVVVVAVLVLGTRQSQVVPFSLGLTPGVVIVYGCLLALLLCWLVRQPIPVPHRATMLLVMVTMASTVVSSAALMLSGPPEPASTNSLLALVRESWLLGLVLFVLVVVRSRAGLENLMGGIVIGATLSGVVGLLAVYLNLDLSTIISLPGLSDQGSLLTGDLQRAGGVRPQGMAGHPLELSAVLTVAFPLAVGLLAAERRRGHSGALWAVASVLLLVAALSTISRSAVIAAVVALVVMAWAWPVRRVAALVAAACVAVFVALALGLPVVTRIAGVLTGGSQDASLDSRGTGLDYALGVLPDHPWFGQGIGTYDVQTQPVLDNYYLGRAVEGGLVGLLAVVAMLVGAVCVAVAARRRFIALGDVGSGELVNGVVGSLTALVVIGLILDVPAFPQISTLQYLLIALAGVAATASRESVAA